MNARQTWNARLQTFLGPARPWRCAVLRVDDQVDEVLPTACVKTGELTDRAVRLTAIGLAHPDRWTLTVGQPLTILLFGVLLRRPMTKVTVPVSQYAWRRWRTRLGIAVALLGIGAALLLAGVVRGSGALVVVAVVTFVVGSVKRARAWNDTWISLQYQPAIGRVVVSRVSAQFDEQAQRLFTRSRQQRAGRVRLR